VTELRAPKDRRSVIALLFLLVAVASAYLPSFGSDFVWDDEPLILESSAVHDPGPWWRPFTEPFWVASESRAGLGSYYRPLTTLSYIIDFRLHGDNPSGYHLSNLLLHLSSTALLWLLIQQLGAKWLTASVVTLLWALLPRLAECVAWISGRADIMAAGWVFGALLLWRPRPLGRWIASLLLLCGLLSKEVAVAGFVAVAVRELSTVERRPRALLVAAAPLLAVLSSYLWLRKSILPSSVEALSLSFFQRASLALEAIGRYLVMVLNPWQPRAFIGQVGRPEPAHAVLGALALVGTAWLLFGYGKRSSPAQRVGISLAIGGILPVLHLVPLPMTTVAADRFLYLPMAGLALAAAPLLQRRGSLGLAVGIGVSLSFFACTWHRAGQWADPVKFWVHAYRTSPRTQLDPTIGLAILERRLGHPVQALSLLDRGLAVEPGANPESVASLVINRAITLTYLGRYEDALASIKDMVKMPGASAKTWFDLSTMQLRLGKMNAAAASLRQALKLYPNYARARKLLLRLPDLERDWQRLQTNDLSMSPAARARALTALGRWQEAEWAWLELLAQTYHSPEIQFAGSYFLEFGTASGLKRALPLLGCDRYTSVLCSALEDHLRRSERLERLLGTDGS